MHYHAFMPQQVPASGSDDLSSEIRPAVQIPIPDLEMQAYLQRYPFASGPQAEMNERCKRTIASGIYLRPPGLRAKPVWLKPADARLSSDEEARAHALLDQIGTPVAEKAIHFDDFAWEASFVPRETKNVLVIGCGHGIELIFLRAVLPEAHITAIDYASDNYNSLLPGLPEAVKLTFFSGDIVKNLLTLSREYDLVFSNHMLEHLYDPDSTLKILADLLVPGGQVLSVLPMVGQPGTPFWEKIHRFVARKIANPAVTIHPLEFIYFDAGHPWKTNPDDLTGTLVRSGFADVRIYQREDHRSRPLQMPMERYRRRRRRLVWLNSLLISPARRVMMFLFPRWVPKSLPSLFFAVERRLPFGTNYIANLFSEEALFLARVVR